MCLGKEEGQCVLEWCASCNFDTTRTALVREMCDCIDDLKYADDEDSFKKKLALLKSGFSGEGAAALNQPGAFASGFSAAAAARRRRRQGSAKAAPQRARRRRRAAPRPRRRGRARARRRRRPATQAPSDAEASSDDAASEDEAAARKRRRRAAAKKKAKKARAAPRAKRAPAKKPATGDRRLATQVYSEAELWARRSPSSATSATSCFRAERGDGPLRQALLDRDARIAVAQPNPKAPGTRIARAPRGLRRATTRSEFLDLGGRRDDLKHDLAKGFVVVVGPGHGRSRVSSGRRRRHDDDDGVIDLGPPAEDKALDAEVAGLLAGGDGDDDAL
ncbi:hypothetical protein SO694_00032378 [Aureococcus anophagefferens]|uniref:Uncharacterized protein n=1 Tax=Aureococcus anophagefferens TaxID=44056 RepID=A0ABR1FKH6_AURAN